MSDFIKGIDISQHQGPDCDFDVVASAGYRFCIVKATEGKDFEDPQFVNNWKKLRDTGSGRIVRGAYHFARPDLRPDWGRSAGELEGRWVSSVLRRVGGTAEGCLPVWLDWEKYTGVPANGSKQVHDNHDWIVGFIDVVQSELGRPPGIYTGRNVWEATLRDLGGAFVEHPLWVVEYTQEGENPATAPSRMPKRASLEAWPWSFWQWSGGGQSAFGEKVPGIPSAGQSAVVDLNRFYGSIEELHALALIVPGSPHPSHPPGISQGILVPQDWRQLASDEASREVAVVQALLLAQGYGPGGLLGPDSHPDGKPGPKSREYLAQFKSSRHVSSPADVVCPTTWYELLRVQRSL